MTNIELAIFIKRVEAICHEMGLVLRQAAFSTNIKDRLDFSCALFDSQGALFAQAAHIPVHLGSMAFALRDVVGSVSWCEGDLLIFNDPFLGGTHLPDVTFISPFFSDHGILGFVVNRAHHANIGSISPGSMPISRALEEEGEIIPPTFLVREGKINEVLLERLTKIGGSAAKGDFAAQRSANDIGLNRLSDLVKTIGLERFQIGIEQVNAYGSRLALAALSTIPKGRFSFGDVIDDDGQGTLDLAIRCYVDISSKCLAINFEGTTAQVAGNVNCPLPVTAAAAFYVFRCLLPEYTPSCAGVFQHLRISAPEGSLVNATRPAAVAAGNVETSMRIVDAILGALHQALPEEIPAASQGTMNNIAMGNHRSKQPWDYYETIGGGCGAHPLGEGVSAVQSHMTNTLNTPIESFESHYPVRVKSYAIRHGSGGSGKYDGGDGLVRELVFLEETEVTLLTDRRNHRPWGLEGGLSGLPGINSLDGRILPAKCQISVKPGQVLRIETPGGGGFGLSNE
ncbi:MAG: hydantoinase B/oxoprolinase family protein [Candidatus Azotimanducaceae bacterium]|nr:5-oxoprolinase [Gammaproteobacteria bacterium]OUV68817.1 MAG: 5-oxoprolinase [Gammaproteobacteria bacterium TMED133]